VDLGDLRPVMGELLVGLPGCQRQLPGRYPVLLVERQPGAGERESRLRDLVLVRFRMFSDAEGAFERRGRVSRTTFGEQGLSERGEGVRDPDMIRAQPAAPPIGSLAEIFLGLGIAAQGLRS